MLVRLLVCIINLLYDSPLHIGPQCLENGAEMSSSLFSPVSFSPERFSRNFSAAPNGTVCTESGTVCTESGTACTESGAVCTESGTVCTESGAVCTESALSVPRVVLSVPRVGLSVPRVGLFDREWALSGTDMEMAGRSCSALLVLRE